MIPIFRAVVPGCAGCAGCAMAHPDFGRSVNPISTRGDRLCPPNYNWHTRTFVPSDGPVIGHKQECLECTFECIDDLDFFMDKNTEFRGKIYKYCIFIGRYLTWYSGRIF